MQKRQDVDLTYADLDHVHIIMTGGLGQRSSGEAACCEK